MQVIVTENHKIIVKFKTKDSISAVEKVYRKVLKFRNKGYLLASADTILRKKDTLKVIFYRGNRFRWQKINCNDSLFYEKFKRFEGKTIDLQMFTGKVDEVSSYYRNNGFPFVSLKSSFHFAGKNKLSAEIIVKKRNFYVFDTIFYDDKKIKLSKNFLMRTTGIRSEYPFDNQKVVMSDKILASYDFINVVAPARVVFHKNTADVYFYLKQTKSNSFSGIAGFSNQSGMFVLTGKADLKVQNIFRRSDYYNFSWESFKPKSQKLVFDFSLPYLFSTGFGFSGDFLFRKNDTSKIDVFASTELFYSFYSANSVGLVYSFRRAIGFDSANIGYLSKFAGISLNFFKLDSRLFPTSGWSLRSRLQAGRSVSTDFAHNRFLFSGDAEIYSKVRRSLVFYTAAKWFWLMGNSLKNSELQMFGGIDDLRGFDNESFSAQKFLISTFEVHIGSAASYFFPFVDYGVYYSENKWNRAIGTGIGMNFRLSDNILNLAFAVGKKGGDAFDFSIAKVHIGFRSVF